MENIPDTPSQPHREGRPKPAYSPFIESCFSGRTGAAAYYRQLLNFLDTQRGTSLMQTPHFYELIDHVQARSEGGNIIFRELQTHLSSPNPRIAVLEGFPSPECINAIGAETWVRPELFIGHLDFSRSPDESQRYFEIPALPSDRSNIIHVRLMTLGQSVTRKKEMKSLARERLAADRECLSFENQLFERKHYGATRFRKVHIHSSQAFSVEQVVSFSVTQRPKQRKPGVFLLDRGKSFKGRLNLPWAQYIRRGRETPDLTPVVPYNSQDGFAQSVSSLTAESACLHPYHPVHSLHIQETGDLDLLRQDPFFILSRLLTEAARSWSQLLNFIEEDIQACSIVSETSLVPFLEQVRFDANLITRAEGFLAESLHVIKERGDASWPKAVDPIAQEKISAIQISLAKNYESLIIRCGHLASMCERGSGILVSAAQLMEAHEGTNQARLVHHLTKLAFIFIPPTYVSSVFGMNVSAFKEYPSIWVYLAVAIPITVLSWLVPGRFEHVSSICGRLYKTIILWGQKAIRGM